MIQNDRSVMTTIKNYFVIISNIIWSEKNNGVADNAVSTISAANGATERTVQTS